MVVPVVRRRERHGDKLPAPPPRAAHQAASRGLRKPGFNAANAVEAPQELIVIVHETARYRDILRPHNLAERLVAHGVRGKTRLSRAVE